MQKHKPIYYIFLVVLTLTAIWAGFYFRDDVVKTYDELGKLAQRFNKEDVQNVVEEFKRQVLTATPLKAGGQANNVVLTAAKVIAQTNVQRYNNGLTVPLIENAKLSAAAKTKAEDMFAKQYFEHVSPTGLDPGTLVKNHGYDYIVTGENLILGNFKDEAEVVQKWMDSPGHRANILNNRFTEIGVAVVKGIYEGQTVRIGVQEFGLPLSACSQPDANFKNQIDANKAKLDELSLQIDAKKEELDNTKRNSPEYNERVDEYNALVNQYNQLAQETKNLIAQYNQQVNNFNECVEGS